MAQLQKSRTLPLLYSRSVSSTSSNYHVFKSHFFYFWRANCWSRRCCCCRRSKISDVENGTPKINEPACCQILRCGSCWYDCHIYDFPLDSIFVQAVCSKQSQEVISYERADICCPVSNTIPRSQKILLTSDRMIRHVLTHRVPGFTSIGHAVLVAVFLAINIILTVTNMDWSSLTPIAKRLGWYVLTGTLSLPLSKAL